MNRIAILPLLALALAACGDPLDPAAAGASTVDISGGDPTANGTLNGAVFGAHYGPGWDTVTAPLPGVTVEIWEVVPAEEMLMLDTIPVDSGVVIDTITRDTVVVDTLPVDPPTKILRGSAITSVTGEFSITGIPAGEYVIYLTPDPESMYAPSMGWTYQSNGSATSAGTFHLWKMEPLMDQGDR